MATKTTKALEPARRLSLWELQPGWIPLLEARIAAETDPELDNERPVCQTCGGSGRVISREKGEGNDGYSEACSTCEGSGRSKSPREVAIEAADLAIAEHSTTEVEKVDSYIGLIRYLEAAIGVRRAEAQRNTVAARILEGMVEQVKATAVFVLNETKRPRLEGSAGYLIAKKNGGVAPLVIPDPTLVPDEFCRFEGSIEGAVWIRMLEICRRHVMVADWDPARLKRVPDNSAIRAKLAGPCDVCNGEPTDENGTPVCGACGGSGTAAVPGAYLGERGVHLEVK